MKKRNKNEPMKATFHVSFQGTQIGGRKASRLKPKKRTKSPNKAKWNRASLGPKNTKINSDWNDRNEHIQQTRNQQNSCANYVSRNQMSKPKPQATKKEDKWHRKWRWTRKYPTNSPVITRYFKPRKNF